jgi:hypothetical protein
VKFIAISEPDAKKREPEQYFWLMAGKGARYPGTSIYLMGAHSPDFSDPWFIFEISPGKPLSREKDINYLGEYGHPIELCVDSTGCVQVEGVPDKEDESCDM